MGSLRDLPVLAPICCQCEVYPVVVQCKINDAFLFTGLNGLQDLECCHIDDHNLRAMRHLALFEKRVVEHIHGDGGEAPVGTKLWLARELGPADVMRRFREVHLAKRGKAVVDELNRRFERDIAFSERTGPSLRQGWWNEDPTPNSPLRNRYGQSYRLVVGLEKVHYAGALNTAIELRDLWRSLPQLNDPSGLNQMAQACEALITQSQSN
jgi:hypothetical protein